MIKVVNQKKKTTGQNRPSPYKRLITGYISATCWPFGKTFLLIFKQNSFHLFFGHLLDLTIIFNEELGLHSLLKNCHHYPQTDVHVLKEIFFMLNLNHLYKCKHRHYDGWSINHQPNKCWFHMWFVYVWFIHFVWKMNKKQVQQQQQQQRSYWFFCVCVFLGWHNLLWFLNYTTL